MTTKTNTNTNGGGGGGGGGFGDKIKGAAQIIHGLGENIRGTALGTADRATSSEAGIQKDDEVAAKGRAEVAEGMARMRGHPAGTVPSDKGTSAGTGTGTGAATAVGAGAGAGVTGQGQQQGTGHEKPTAVREKSGPETTGSGAALTSRGATSGVGEQTSAGSGTGTVTGTGATAAPAAGAGAIGQDTQGTGYEKTGAAGRKSGPAMTGSSAAQAGHEAAGTGEQKQQDPSAGSQQEGKRDDRDVQERSQSCDTGQSRAQTENRPQQTGERSSQQRVGEQYKAGQMGVQRENGQQDECVAPRGKPCIRFQGISMDGGGEPSEQQTAEKAHEAGQIHHEGAQQEGGQGQIRFQDFQGAGI
ncbi:hypothetical protein DEU56DRAFT_979587 [Suillus clintonianus]|uniref:uncharacterized protein n=1 Tax=Suillus clintonianus TaxID=1904413 RepID=UPI001B86B68C|nr:uncharacterized protein DEU56DRAFT_979587 [Suillus clintonianus]KAG2142410.1 hypothetical protein DEU56DRAFT_979587 [Suillus clintonianus]